MSASSVRHLRRRKGGIARCSCAREGLIPRYVAITTSFGTSSFGGGSCRRDLYGGRYLHRYPQNLSSLRRGATTIRSIQGAQLPIHLMGSQGHIFRAIRQHFRGCPADVLFRCLQRGAPREDAAAASAPIVRHPCCSPPPGETKGANKSGHDGDAGGLRRNNGGQRFALTRFRSSGFPARDAYVCASRHDRENLSVLACHGGAGARSGRAVIVGSRAPSGLMSLCFPAQFGAVGGGRAAVCCARSQRCAVRGGAVCGGLWQRVGRGAARSGGGGRDV